MATTLFSLPAQPLHPLPAPPQPPHHAPESHHATHAPPGPAHEAGSGVDLGTLTGRRITLKPRRTLSLSPTPARTGDNSDNSMGRNLRAARCLDFTDKDDDDGLYQPSSDSEPEPQQPKKKGDGDDNDGDGGTNATTTLPATTTSTLSQKLSRHKRCNSVGAAIGTGTGTGASELAAALGTASTLRKPTGSVKRPLDIILPCQEIQYLDISYQKVGTVMVQYSPIPRKKIAYHHVPYNSIPLCDVPYYGTSERPIKRKPLQRSHSIAVADLREPEDCEWSSYKLR